jgi:hypothetical protein
MSTPRIAFLAQGKVFFLDDRSEPREWKSPFAELVAERHQRIEQKHAWKAEGRGARFMRGGMAWEMPGMEGPVAAPHFTGLSLASEAGSLIYTIRVAGIQGICRFRGEENDELRLLHGSNDVPQDLSSAPGQAYIACSMRQADGSAHIGVMDREAGDLRQLTEGDTVDLCPSWIPGGPGHLVFQSCGIGRNAQGFAQALAPSCIQRLDVQSGDLKTLLEDPSHDFMAPQMDAEGNLYCIRKTYGWKPSTKGFLRFLLDILLIPFRILKAIYQYMNFFSAKYTGKPLTTAGEAKKEGADLKQMWLYGNLINAQAAMEDGAKKGEENPGVVPRDWQLIRVPKDGTPEVMASGVSGFSLGPDGRMVYTNGSALFEKQAEVGFRKIFTFAGIQRVVLL